MKDFGKYIRLDNWEEAEELGLEEGFRGNVSDRPNRDLEEVDFYVKIYKSTCGKKFQPFRFGLDYAYVLKSSLPKKEEFKAGDRALSGVTEVVILQGLVEFMGKKIYTVGWADGSFSAVREEKLEPIPWKRVTSLKDLTDAGLELGCEVKDEKGRMAKLRGVLWIGDRLVFRVMDSSGFRKSDEIYVRSS